MKTYKTVNEYLKETKPNDKVIFGGKGIVDGLKNRTKSNTYTIKAIKDDGTLSLRAYRGRTNLILGANAYDQQIIVVGEKEFKEMPVY